jgi:hypothetical protein
MADCKKFSNIFTRVLKMDQKEYQENESGLTVEDTDFRQTINLYGCKNSTIIVKGKVNAVTLGSIFLLSWHYNILLTITLLQ